jgi:sugar diacid utilization regulator
MRSDKFLTNFGVELDFGKTLRKIQHDKNIANKAIQTLEFYDEQHNTGFTETLYSYVEFGFNKQAVAKDLGFHINTIKHRITRIGEITNIDMTIPKNVLYIYFCLQCKEVFASEAV